MKKLGKFRSLIYNEPIVTVETQEVKTIKRFLGKGEILNISKIFPQIRNGHQFPEEKVDGYIILTEFGKDFCIPVEDVVTINW